MVSFEHCGGGWNCHGKQARLYPFQIQFWNSSYCDPFRGHFSWLGVGETDWLDPEKASSVVAHYSSFAIILWICRTNKLELTI